MTVATACVALLTTLAVAGPQPIRLAVPIVRQAPERCGPAALGMVLRYYGAPDSALARAEGAYDPVLHGALITDLAHAAETSGYPVRVSEADADTLRAALAADTPPIVIYDVGFGPLSKRHFAVVVGWEPDAQRFVLHDGGAKPREMKQSKLLSQWKKAGFLALIVARRP